MINTITGEVILALPQGTELPPYRAKETVLICGHQPEMLRQAVEFGVGCIVLCQAELPEDIRSAAKNTCIISTPYDSLPHRPPDLPGHPRQPGVPEEGPAVLPPHRLHRRRP